MKEKGAALVEFAVTIPIFIILLVGLVDVFFIIQKNQFMSVLVRELGNSAYRDCRQASAGASTTSCLQQSASQSVSYKSNSGQTLNGVQIIIKSWQVNKTGQPTVKGSYVVGNFQSIYNATTVSKLNSYDAKLRDTLITVELFLDNSKNPFFGFSRTLNERMIF